MTSQNSKVYIDLAIDILGDDWLRATTFRFRASGLLNNLLATLVVADKKQTSGY